MGRAMREESALGLLRQTEFTGYGQLEGQAYSVTRVAKKKRTHIKEQARFGLEANSHIANFFNRLTGVRLDEHQGLI
jgi:hypothetical protein